MNRLGRRRRQREIYLGQFYLNPSMQYMSTVVSAIVLAGLVFTGLLLFRFTDEEDLISRGKIQLAQGKAAMAAKTFQILVNHHPRSYEGHLLLGQAYLETDERVKAEREFEMAASLQRGHGDNAPDIAISKVAMAKGNFIEAEQILLKAYRHKHRNDPDTRQALFELYDEWGNTLSDSEQKDYAAIVEKYERSLRYVRDSETQKEVEEKLIDSIHMYTDDLMRKKDYDRAIHQLRISLRFKYTPETLMQIGEAYARMNRTDDAIEWYRQAFDTNPSIIGLRFANLLVQKGQALVEQKKPEEAQRYFNEADEVSQKAKVPLYNLYPVSVNQVKISYKVDRETGELEPTVQVKIANDSPRSLNYLAAKVEFYTGDELLAETTQVVANPDKPLGMQGDSKASTRSLTFKPDTTLNVHALEGNKLMVKVSIAYHDGEKQDWRVKTIQEINLKAPEQAAPSAKPV